MRTLSASPQANVYIEAAHEGCDMNVKISRTRFEDLCFDLYKAATEVISKALAQAGAAPEKADMVLLAGGETGSGLGMVRLSVGPFRGRFLPFCSILFRLLGCLLVLLQESCRCQRWLPR